MTVQNRNKWGVIWRHFKYIIYKPYIYRRIYMLIRQNMMYVYSRNRKKRAHILCSLPWEASCQQG